MNMAKVTDKDHVRIVDSLTIEMDLEEANSLLFGNMAQGGHSILNPKVEHWRQRFAFAGMTEMHPRIDSHVSVA